MTALPKGMFLIHFGLKLGMYGIVGGTVASWLVHSSLERAVQVRALAGDTVLYCWARHLALTMPLSTQEYKWVPINCWGNASCYRNQGYAPAAMIQQDLRLHFFWYGLGKSQICK